jgi:Fuc2NAc and GlcNAc transferase
VVGVVWVLNLFNFMDGIDGIAASEAAFVACGGALLMHLAGTNTGISSAGLVFGAACVGFLFWNWPPAKIFMGDVGSGYVGYVLGVLALAAAHENSAVAWVWLALGGLFFVDATVTLVRRALQGERLQDAHRRHAYQWLARRWRSHRRVTLTVIALNVFWLLPCALIAALRPALAFRVLMVALAPLVVLVLVAGAGRRENIVS